MNAASPTPSPALPAGIADLLTGVRRRIRCQQCLAGGLKVTAVAAGCLTAAIAAEAFGILSAGTIRLMLLCAGAPLIAGGIWWWLVRPLKDLPEPGALARWLDARHPETQERLTTAVNLAGTGGSLVEAVIEEAAADAASLDPARELPHSRLRPVFTTAGIALLLLVVAVLLRPQSMGILAGRPLPAADSSVESGDPDAAGAAAPGDEAADDAAPVVTLEEPAMDGITLRPGTPLPLVYSVQEDGGITAVHLLIRPENGPEILQPLPLPEADEFPGRWSGDALLDTSRIPDGVRDFRAAVVVTDNREARLGGPQAGVSREITVRIRGDARSLLEQAWEDEARRLQQMMQETEQTLREAEQRMRQVADRMRGEGEVPQETFRQLDEGMQMAAEGQAAMEQMAGQMEDSPFTAQSESMQQAAREFAGAAAQQAAEIPQTDDRDERAELASQAAEKLARAVDSLRSERQRLEEAKREVMRAAQVVDLAERQNALAETAEAAVAAGEEASRNREAAEQWIREEQDVARRAEELRSSIDEMAVRRTEAMRQAVARHREELELGAKSAADAARVAATGPDEGAQNGESGGGGEEGDGEAPESGPTGNDGADPDGSGPDIATGAEQAREAAGHLRAAAEAVLESMGMTPPGAGQATASGSQKPGRQGGRQAKPAQGGGNASQQQELPAGAVPGAIALPGMTPAEWAVVRGIVRGATGGESDRVPPEYRQMVRQYFERLSRVTAAGPPPAPREK